MYFPGGRDEGGLDYLHLTENRGDKCFQPDEWKLETLVSAQLHKIIMIPSEGRLNQQRDEEIKKGGGVNRP